MTVEVITFGCRLNSYESEVIKKKAEEEGLENFYIINSCAVTSEAERQVRQEIRKLKKLDPNKKILVTGCAAQINPAKYQEMEEVSLVLGNNEKLERESYAKIKNQDKMTLVQDIFQRKEVEKAVVESFEGKVRGFLQVQTGCNHLCTFCIIPYGRGKSVSTPFGPLFEEGKKLLEAGYKELVITGVDITDYGLDLPGQPSLGQLIKRLLKFLPDLPRIRLSSLDVAEIDKDLMDLIANEPRLMPHFHLSLQSGDNLILKRMKRRHSREDIITFYERVLQMRPDALFGADIIAGFPTETDELFQNTYDLISQLEKIVHLHIFPYSERSGTPAARMPQVPKIIRKTRAKALRELGNKALNAQLQGKIGKKIKFLVENNNIGRSEDFCLVKLDKNESLGSILEAEVKGLESFKLLV
jgi:threonylcarbamoyladenosine tRNA methylthiotransferase MtaB